MTSAATLRIVTGGLDGICIRNTRNSLACISTFAAMVAKLDESVGRVVAALERKGMLNNSIIVFTSDNGGAAAGFNGNAGSNWPLRGVINFPI
jgi:arylsulfatase A-like enzyme